ncbi:MAG: hypothetical protein JWO45_2200, partial [Spartobacteria bacterium]|nr:hypothetical protein [Spartobacteria bacterium]
MFLFQLRRIGLPFFVFVISGILQSRAGATDKLGVLGSHPRWKVLENYQETITREEF